MTQYSGKWLLTASSWSRPKWNSFSDQTRPGKRMNGPASLLHSWRWVLLVLKFILEWFVSKRYLITFFSEAGWSMQENQKDGRPCWLFQNTHHYAVFVFSKTLITIHLYLYFPKHTSQQYFSSVCLTINYSSKLLSSHRSFQVLRSLRLYYVPIGITMWSQYLSIDALYITSSFNCLVLWPTMSEDGASLKMIA